MLFRYECHDLVSQFGEVADGGLLADVEANRYHGYPPHECYSISLNGRRTVIVPCCWFWPEYDRRIVLAWKGSIFLRYDIYSGLEGCFSPAENCRTGFHCQILT